ncbi:MAG: hypothetical protein NVSMB6_21380 [Burkholderiaceae bacterium]
MRTKHANVLAIAVLILGLAGGIIVRQVHWNMQRKHNDTTRTVAQKSALPGRFGLGRKASAARVRNSAKESTLGRIALFQVFDYGMTDAQAQAAAKRTDIVWGSGVGASGATARSWDGTLMNARYAYQPADAQMITHRTVDSYNASGHGDWVVYDCDQDNNPTHTPAFQPGIGTSVSIDFTNEEAVKDQVDRVADFATTHGNNAIALDQTVFFIYDGGQHPNWYGCGIWKKNGMFRRLWTQTPAHFPGFHNKKWAADTAQWAVFARKEMRARYPGLKLIVNHPAGNINDPNERKLLANVDGTANENGYVNYGRYIHNPRLFHETLKYTRYVQSLGIPVLTIDKFSGGVAGGGSSGTLSAQELTWVMATYLIGNEGREYLFTTRGDGYGSEQYHPEYKIAERLGKPCGPFSGGSNVYTRRFAHGIVTVDAISTVATISEKGGCR